MINPLKTLSLFALYSLLALILSGTVHADKEGSIAATVVAVSDGDTVKVKTTQGEILTVRLYGVDSPETEWTGRWPGQPYGQRAKGFMTNLLLNRKVSVRIHTQTSYSRKIGEVLINGDSAGTELVKAGLGWWYTRYAPNNLELKRNEALARSEKRGIWSQNNPEAPWIYRRRNK